MTLCEKLGLLLFTAACIGGLLSIPDIGRILAAGIFAICGIGIFALGDKMVQ